MIVEEVKTLDLDLDVGSPEDTIKRYYAQKPPSGAVELWTIVDGLHSPTIHSDELSSELPTAILDWLFEHPKP